MFMRERLTVKTFLFLCVGVFGLLFYNALVNAEYKEKDVSGGGTIEGTVKWAGQIPEVTQFVVTKDTEHCKAEKKPSPRLLVNASNNGVKNTVVYLVNIGEGKKMAELPATLVLNQTECQYDPHVYVVPVGAEFAMTTSDDILHNIHMFGVANYNLAFPVKGQKIAKKMRKSGVVDVVCDAGHYWMSAEIHVVEHPYYAVTDGDGKFKIEKVPAGAYKLAAWHEGWKVVKQEEKDGKPSKVLFSDPVVVEKDAKVAGGDTVTVDFELSDK